MTIGQLTEGSSSHVNEAMVLVRTGGINDTVSQGTNPIAYGPFRASNGGETPHFYRQLRSGALLPVNSWFQQEIRTISCTGSSQFTHPNGGNPVLHTVSRPAYWGAAGLNPFFVTTEEMDAVLDHSLKEYVVQSAVAKITSAAHDTLTSVAEFRKTVQMFRGIAPRILRLLSSTSPRDWASAWAEGRYGWRPLLFDLQDLQKAVERFNSTNDFFRARSEQKRSWTDIHTQDGGHSGALSWTYVRKRKWEVSYRGFAFTNVKPPSFGFNPVKTAWELLPWSFVIDWFINIGLWIDVISASYLDAPYSSGLGTSVKCTIITTIEGAQPVSPMTSGSCTGTVVAECSQIRRDPWTPSLLPQLNVRLDGYKVTDLLSFLLTSSGSRKFLKI